MSKYISLSEEEIEWTPKSKPRKNASKNHKNAVELVEEIFVNIPYHEECRIPTGDKTRLYMDIYIPSFGIAIEVDGQQHEKFNTHFHRSRMDFLKQQANDRKKEEWCELNNIILVRVSEKDNVDTWREQITEAKKRGDSGEV